MGCFPSTRACSRGAGRPSLAAQMLTVTLGICSLSAHAVEFPSTAVSKDQARACLQRAFDSSTPRDKQVFSQVGEDGIIESIFECIGTTDRYFVEFGVENGEQCTTRNLRENHTFTGLMMDGGNSRPEINLQQEMIFSHNIAQLFEKHKVPKPTFDHLTIDLDQNTFWIAQAVLHAGYRPRSLAVEYNRNLAWTDSYATIDMPNEMAFLPDVSNTMVGDCYFGASANAWVVLAKSYGYHFVAADQAGINLFFVHESAMGSKPLFTLEDAKRLFSQGREHGALHGQCVRHVWVKVPEGTDFAAADFKASQLQKVLLSHKASGGQRIFYEVSTDDDLSAVAPSKYVSTKVVTATQGFDQLLPKRNAGSSQAASRIEVWALACLMLVSFAAGTVVQLLCPLHRVWGFVQPKRNKHIGI